MMRISFVVVLQGAQRPSAKGPAKGPAARVAQMRAALCGLQASARPGDEVIVVDAPPRTAPGWLAGAEAGWLAVPGAPDPDPLQAAGAALRWRVLRLGTRGPLPHAVAANAGLAQARGDAVMLLSGLEVADPAGIKAARAALARQGGGLVLGGIAGSASVTPLGALCHRPRVAQMLLHRDLLHPPGHRTPPLRLPEAAARPEMLLVWRACLQALVSPVIGATPLPLVQPPSGEEPACIAPLPGLFDDHRRLCALLPRSGNDAAALQALARVELLVPLGQWLHEGDPESFWSLAEAARPTALSAPARDWLRAGAVTGTDGGTGAVLTGLREPQQTWLRTGARAMAQLAGQPLLAAVALWQGDALWRRHCAQLGADGGDADPQQAASAVTAARALWQELRRTPPI